MRRREYLRAPREVDSRVLSAYARDIILTFGDTSNLEQGEFSTFVSWQSNEEYCTLYGNLDATQHPSYMLQITDSTSETTICYMFEHGTKAISKASSEDCEMNIRDEQNRLIGATKCDIAMTAPTILKYLRTNSGDLFTEGYGYTRHHVDEPVMDKTGDDALYAIEEGEMLNAIIARAFTDKAIHLESIMDGYGEHRYADVPRHAAQLALKESKYLCDRAFRDAAELSLRWRVEAEIANRARAAGAN